MLDLNDDGPTASLMALLDKAEAKCRDRLRRSNFARACGRSSAPMVAG